MELSVARLITTGCVFTDRHVAPLAKNTPFRWISYLRNTASIEVPAGDADKFLAELLCAPNLPPLKLPDELRYEEVTTKPHFHLKISTPRYANPAARLPVVDLLRGLAIERVNQVWSTDITDIRLRSGFV